MIELRNQTVVAAARAALKQRGMPAVYRGMHLLNQSPNKALDGKMPYQA